MRDIDDLQTTITLGPLNRAVQYCSARILRQGIGMISAQCLHAREFWCQSIFSAGNSGVRASFRE